MNYIKLENDVEIPLLGYGTLQISQKIAEQCVLNALEEGYRLIDTAASYFNEVEIGKAIKKSKLPRNDIFITTKVWVQDAGYEATKKAFQTSLENLQMDYIDLYLIHQPYGDYYGSWRAMEELYKQGKIRAIGVCNFSSERFVDLCLNCSIRPMINQIEYHPFFQQHELAKITNAFKCQVQAWGPLAEGQRKIFEHETLSLIAKKHQRTIPQIVLRWHVQNNMIAIPKTIHQDRMKENMAIWDFELDDQDLELIANMDIGYSEIINHQSYTTAKWLNKYRIHD